jgi:hypothetical protein
VYFHLLHPEDPFPHPSHMTIYSCHHHHHHFRCQFHK